MISYFFLFFSTFNTTVHIIAKRVDEASHVPVNVSNKTTITHENALNGWERGHSLLTLLRNHNSDFKSSARLNFSQVRWFLFDNSFCYADFEFISASLLVVRCKALQRLQIGRYFQKFLSNVAGVESKEISDRRGMGATRSSA